MDSYSIWFSTVQTAGTSAKWFPIVQTLGIIGGLLFTAFSMRTANKARRVENLLKITQFHRDIWGRLYTNPELARVTNVAPNLEERPISDHERLFVKLLVNHLVTAIEADKASAIVPVEGTRQDVREFFRLPIPNAVWKEIRQYQNESFRTFVDELVKE